MKLLNYLKLTTAAAALCCCSCSFDKPARAAPQFFLIEDKAGSNIRTYDFVSLNYSLKTQEGKLISGTGKFDQRPLLRYAGNPRFKGDLNTALLKMSEGDSAVVPVVLDSMVFKTHMQRPDTKGKFLLYTIKINKVLTRGFMSNNELSSAIEAMQLQETTKAKVSELRKISNFLSLQNLQAAVFPSGLLILTTISKPLKVTGKTSVSITYQISSLDGTLFETNDSVLARKAGIYNAHVNYRPYAITPDIASKHWLQQAASVLNPGEQTAFIVPSKLAYGQLGTRNVGPYAPLLCQIQLITAKSNSLYP